MDQEEPRAVPGWMLQLLLNNIPIRVFWKDRESIYQGCNHLFAADAGFSSADDVVGKSDYDMPWKEQADRYRADDRTIMSSGEPKLNYEDLQTIEGGRAIQLRVSKIPLRDEEGNITGVLGIHEDITDRKEAEADLRDREALYRCMFESSPFSVALNDLSGRFLDVNDKFEQIVGVPRQEAIGHTPAELGIMDSATQTAILEAIGLTGAKLEGYEIAARTRAGETKYALISTAVVNVKEEPLILSILNDITERREAEHALRRSEEKYRELVQNANSIILRWGRDGAVRFLNEFGQTFFGVGEAEILGQSVMDTIVPKTETSGRDLEVMIADIEAHPEYHGTNVNENVRKNGERVWIAWTNKPVFDEEGQITEILSVGLDITTRIQDQQALQESETRYRSIFNSNVDAFLLLDVDGCIVDANARAAELYGYSREELAGLCGTVLVDPGSEEVMDKLVGMSPGEWFHLESTNLRRSGGKFDVELHGAKLRYGSLERILVIVFDVTERTRARESMQLFTNVVNNMQVGLHIYRLEDPSDNRTLKLQAANPAITTEFGIAESQAVGKYIDEALPGLREHGIPEHLAEVVLSGNPFNMADFEYHGGGPSSRHYSFRAFCLPDNQVGVLFDDITDVVHAEEDKRRFYRRTIEAATEGKLIVCDRRDIEQIAGPPIATYDIRTTQDVGFARHRFTETARSEGMDEIKLCDLALCVGEAATNAIKHAKGGTATIHRRNGSLLVVISDNGPGIHEINLPDLALKKRYTTALSLGIGYKAMISTADQVHLATGPEGTTVAIEMSLQPVEKPLTFDDLPDLWTDDQPTSVE